MRRRARADVDRAVAVAEHGHVPGRRPALEREEPQDRRLARPVGAEHHPPFVAARGPVHVAEDDRALLDQTDAVELECGRGGHRRIMPGSGARRHNGRGVRSNGERRRRGRDRCRSQRARWPQTCSPTPAGVCSCSRRNPSRAAPSAAPSSPIPATCTTCSARSTRSAPRRRSCAPSTSSRTGCAGAARRSCSRTPPPTDGARSCRWTSTRPRRRSTSSRRATATPGARSTAEFERVSAPILESMTSPFPPVRGPVRPGRRARAARPGRVHPPVVAVGAAPVPGALPGRGRGPAPHRQRDAQRPRARRPAERVPRVVPHRSWASSTASPSPRAAPGS